MSVSLSLCPYLSHSSVSVSIECVSVLHILCHTVTSASQLRLKPNGSATYHAQSNFNIVQLYCAWDFYGALVH